jgi:hypothetical protein
MDDTNEQASVQGDQAAKVIAGVIIAGISAMFAYVILHWTFFE